MRSAKAGGVVFKCHFGGKAGWGHVVRSSALAVAFRARGWRTSLWTSSDQTLLPGEVAAAFNAIGTEAEEGALVLVVDEMYTADEELKELAGWWRGLGGRRLLVGIDDMRIRSMAGFDLVVNTEIGLRQAAYASRQALLGERYALLRGGFATPAALEPWPLPESAIKALVMLGGTDAFGYTARVLKCLDRWGGEAVAPVVVLGAGAPSRSELEEALGCFCGGQLLERQSSAQLAAWMQRCDLGVTACGSSLYELAAMRLPFVGLSVVDNQRSTAAQVRELWGLPVVSREDRHAEPLDLADAFDAALRRRGTRYSEVDTNGPERVFEAIARLLR